MGNKFSQQPNELKKIGDKLTQACLVNNWNYFKELPELPTPFRSREYCMKAKVTNYKYILMVHFWYNMDSSIVNNNLRFLAS